MPFGVLMLIIVILSIGEDSEICLVGSISIMVHRHRVVQVTSGIDQADLSTTLPARYHRRCSYFLMRREKYLREVEMTRNSRSTSTDGQCAAQVVVFCVSPEK